jgi:hypothetical protein
MRRHGSVYGGGARGAQESQRFKGFAADDDQATLQEIRSSLFRTTIDHHSEGYMTLTPARQVKP